MTTLRRVALMFALTLFGVMALALPAVAAECEMRSSGNVVCDGQEFQPVAPVPSLDAAAKPAAQGITLSQEEADAISELEEEEKRTRLHGYIMSVVYFLSGVVIVFAVFSKAYNSKRWFSRDEMVIIMWIGVPLLATSVLFYMYAPPDMSIEERVEEHQSPSNFVEKEKRMMHLRKIRQQVVERELNEREANKRDVRRSPEPSGSCTHGWWGDTC